MKLVLKSKPAPRETKGARLVEGIVCAGCGKEMASSQACVMPWVTSFVHDDFCGQQHTCDEECMSVWLAKLSKLVLLGRDALMKKLPPNVVHHEMKR